MLHKKAFGKLLIPGYLLQIQRTEILFQKCLSHLLYRDDCIDLPGSKQAVIGIHKGSINNTAAFHIGFKSAFIIILNTVIIPNSKYNNAIALMEAGNVVEAYEALVALDGYKDSADKANSIYDQYKVGKLKIAKAGDYVFFGTYEQDNNTSNGK